MKIHIRKIKVGDKVLVSGKSEGISSRWLKVIGISAATSMSAIQVETETGGKAWVFNASILDYRPQSTLDKKAVEA